MSSFLSDVNTKLKAYNLVLEPILLLSLLYAKYGDIEEDLNILLIDQLVFNQSTHFNNIFKEYLFFNNNIEFLKRFYNNNETCSRIPKLGDHYKNYYAYYCRPFFIDIYHSNLMKKYYNTKAEIFYKNKYSSKESTSRKITNSIIDSFDNDTENKTIFNKKNKFLIDNNIESKKSSIILTLDNINENNDNNGLISINSENDSFAKFLKNYFFGESNMENKEINNAITKNDDKSNINSEQKTKIINKYNFEKCYLNNINICLHNYKNNKIKLYGNKTNNTKKIKDNSYINILSNIKKNFYNISKKIKSREKALKLSRNRSNLEKYEVSSLNTNKNRKKSIDKIVNEEFYFSNDNIKNIKSNKKKNYKKKSIKNLFFNLNSKKASIDKIKSRNNKKTNELNFFNSNNFISLKNSRNNINCIKLLKLNKKSNIFNNIKILSNNKNSDIKIDYKKLIKNTKKKGRNNCNKQTILNKISSQNSINSKSNNNQNINKPHKLLSPKGVNSIRNKIIFRRNSKLTNKLILLDSASYEKKNFNITPIRKANSKLFKSNSSYSRNKSGSNKFIGGTKYNINNSKRQKKLNLKFLQNMLNKNNFKNFLNKINSLKNNSRNKTNNLNIFYSKSSLAQSLMGSLSQSKSKSRSRSKSINKEDTNNKILIKTNFITKSIDINNNYKKNINPIKMTRNKIIKEKMKEIMKNSSMLEKKFGLSEEKYSHIKNNNIFKTFIKNTKKNISKPINLRKKLNNNNIFFKNIKNN